jgi:hypothetical protein
MWGNAGKCLVCRQLSLECVNALKLVMVMGWAASVPIDKLLLLESLYCGKFV